MELLPVFEAMDEFAGEPLRTHGTDGEVEMNGRALAIRTFEEVHRTIIGTGTDRASRTIESFHSRFAYLADPDAFRLPQAAAHAVGRINEISQPRQGVVEKRSKPHGRDTTRPTLR